MIERKLKTSAIKVPFPDWMKNLYTMFLVTVGWVIFRIEDFNMLLEYLKTMFGIHRTDWIQYQLGYYIDRRSIFILVIAILLSYNLKDKIKNQKFKKMSVETIEILENIVSIVLFIICVIAMANSTYNPFIYFKF